MLHQLANLPDTELMARARKLKDEEAAGILLERYSHLLAAVSLPSLNNYDNTPDQFFPSLIQRLFNSLHTQTIPKIGEWMQFFIKSQGSRAARNTYYFPSSASREITRLEYKVEKANSLQKQQLTDTMVNVFDNLSEADRDLLNEFYFEQKTFAEIAIERGYTIEETRIKIKNSKQELASIMVDTLEQARPEMQEKEEPATLIIETPVRRTRKPKLATLTADEEMGTLTVEAPVRAKPKKQKVAALTIDAQEPARPKKQKRTTLIVQPVEQTIAEEQETIAIPELATPEIQEPKSKPETIILEYNIQPALSINDNQEQDINIGYAKFGKQGQDIKDLQQGSLF